MRFSGRGRGRLAVLAALVVVVVLALAGSAQAATVTNGDFETGDFTGWTTFTTSNGTTDSPTVTSFNTTGNGASDAADFNVGESYYDRTEQGGGLYQNVTLAAGAYRVSADIAAATGTSNGDCGTFSLQVDGSTAAQHAFGPCPPATTERDHLSGRFTVSSGGSHELRILITRHYTAGRGATPDQYVDDVAIIPALAISCSPSSVTVGDATTCTATEPEVGSNAATGAVSFSTGSHGSFTSNGSSGPSESCTLAATAGGSACSVTYTPSQVNSGTHTITAAYGGEGAYPSDSATTTVAVAKASPTTGVSCSPSSLTVGNATTCTATVSGVAGAAAPGGTVSFASDSGGSFSSSGSCTLATTAGGQQCSVTYTPSQVDSGTHTISATYGGDDNYDAPGSPATTTVAVARRQSGTAVSCVPGTVTIGTATTCTATVSDTDSGSASTPTGTVAFSDGGAGSSFAPASCTLSATGSGTDASCSVVYTSPTSSSQITAAYSGDSLHDTSSGEVTVSGTARSSGTAVSCSPASVTLGGATTCTATVSDKDLGSAGRPSGTVIFTSDSPGSFSPASCTLPSSGADSCQVTFTPAAPGSASVKAAYAGDESHNGSSATTSVAVAADPASGVAAAPAAKGCVDTRHFGFTLHHRAGMRIVDAKVYVNGRKALEKRGRALGRFTIGRLVQGTFSVRIISTQSNGTKVISVRTYRGCTQTAPHSREARKRTRRPTPRFAG